MLEWTSIPAASGLTRLSSGDEAGTGMASDLSGDFLGLAGFLGFLGFFGSSFGTTMDASGWRMWTVKPQGATSQEGYRGRLKSPQRDQYHAGKTRNSKSPMTRSMPLGPRFEPGKKHQRDGRPLTRVAVRQCKGTNPYEPDPLDPEFTGSEGAARGGS